MKVRTYLASLLIMLLVVSCEYETITYEAKLPENVSFENDILPLFDQNCNMVGCHSAGSVPPDLSHDNAYASLKADEDLVEANDPESSELYLRMTDNVRPMPLSGALTPSQTNLVLVWIQEGALKN